MAALSVLLLAIMLRSGYQTIRIKFADGQVTIFYSMVDKSMSSTNLADIASYLAYAHVYYTSGSKQIPGSTLDRVVEKVRRRSEAQIIQRMKVLSGQDLGEDPEKWITRYRAK
ncbi:hypothetical protein GC207_09420 [bacterium]|nr:hypothetical protein [bacterium]